MRWPCALLAPVVPLPRQLEAVASSAASSSQPGVTCGPATAYPRMDRPVSRKGAKYAKIAKQRRDFAFAFRRAFAALHELF
jgi:hypothetical protein